MKVIAGINKGRHLKLSKMRIRPTRAMVRSAIFNVLGERVKYARVIDIFAGTGALGIEALSRGARFCVFIENQPKALIQNIRMLNLQNWTKVINLDFRPGIKKLSGMKFDIVFIDPPYKSSYLNQALKLLYFYKLLSKDSIIVAEHSYISPGIIPDEYKILKEKKYGSTLIYFLQIKTKGVENEKGSLCRDI